MEFTIKGKSNNEVSITKETLNKIINILDKVECTCIWSEIDQQYIKINDIPTDLVDELLIKMKFAS